MFKFFNQNQISKKFFHLFKNVFHLFYPNLCIECSISLIEHEKFLCTSCLLDLPKTNYHLNPDNPASELFLGKVSVQKASAYLYYNKGGFGQKLISAIKYKGNIYLGEWIGAYMAKEMLPSGFFSDIDFLIPVPLHKKKLKIRGFNQSEVIAKGISSITQIPIENKNLYRTKFNMTQTKKGVYERWENTQQIFELANKELFKNKHILIIDDVLTTGATLESCIQALFKSENIKISILTLCVA